MSLSSFNPGGELGLVFIVGAVLTWIMMLFAIAGVIKSRHDPVERVMWIIIVIFVPFFGPLFWWNRPNAR